MLSGIVGLELETQACQGDTLLADTQFGKASYVFITCLNTNE